MDVSKYETWNDMLQAIYKKQSDLTESDLTESDLTPYRLYPIAKIQPRDDIGKKIFDIVFNFVSFHIYA